MNKEEEDNLETYRIIGYITIFGGIISSILSFITFNPSEGVPISVMPHDYSSIFFTLGLGFISIGIALISIQISIDSGKIAKKSNIIAEESKIIAQDSKIISEESKARMDTIGDAEIKQSIINLERLRKEYFINLEEFLNTRIALGIPVNFNLIQLVNIFTTWLEVQNIRKAIVYKDYIIDDGERLKFFRLHRTLIENVLGNSENPNQLPIVSNESVSQLLTGIIELYDNLEETINFHQEYYAVLNGYLGMISANESFLDYVRRKKQEIDQLEEHDFFNFQTIDEIQIS